MSPGRRGGFGDSLQKTHSIGCTSGDSGLTLRRHILSRLHVISSLWLAYRVEMVGRSLGVRRIRLDDPRWSEGAFHRQLHFS